MGEEPDLADSFDIVQLPDSHPASRYLGYGQNDAHILGIAVGRNYVEVTLSHYDVGRLACEFFDGPFQTWPKVHAAFPVTLRFEDVSELVILRRVEQSVFQKIRCCQSTVGTVTYDICRMDCVHIGSDRQSYVLGLNGRPTKHARLRRSKNFGSGYTNEYNLCITSSALTVREGYREDWIRFFQGQHLDVLDAFESVWPVPRWLMEDFEQWLMEGMPTGPGDKVRMP